MSETADASSTAREEDWWSAELMETLVDVLTSDDPSCKADFEFVSICPMAHGG
jgi:hypothetical protein